MIVFKWLTITVLIQSAIFLVYFLYVLNKDRKELRKKPTEWEY